MKIKKLVSFTIFLFIVACDGNSGGGVDCPEGGPIKFDITDVNIELSVASGSNKAPYNEIIHSDLTISINSVTQIISSIKEKSKTNNFSFISSAYACSPAPPSTNEKIVDFKISSSSPFNDELAAGNSLKSKFEVVFADSETQYVDYSNNTEVYFNLNRYLEQENVYAGNKIRIKLNEAPKFVDNHIFFIELSLDSGEVFLLETPEINFLKI